MIQHTRAPRTRDKQWWKCYCRQRRFRIMITEPELYLTSPMRRGGDALIAEGCIRECGESLQLGSNVIVVSPLLASHY